MGIRAQNRWKQLRNVINAVIALSKRERGFAYESLQSRRRSRYSKPLFFLGFALVIILGSIAAGIVYHKLKAQSPARSSSSSSPSAIKTNACNSTRYPQECASALSYFPSSGPYSVLISSAFAALKGISHILDLSRSYNGTGNASVKAVYKDCEFLLDRSVQDVNSSINEFFKLGIVPNKHKLQDLQTWMSASMTFYMNCIDGLQQFSSIQVVENGTIARKHLSNALWLLNALYSLRNKLSFGHQRRLLSSSIAHSSTMPRWVERRLFQSDSYDAIVAKDGTGQYSTIQDAVDAAPLNSATKYVIHIKSGTYAETVNVPRNKTNLMFVGDGIGNTVITGNNNVKLAGATTISSATVGIDGAGFIAQDLTIQNTAGPEGEQAVALRMSADHAAFLSCSFEGNQDTLLAHAYRQFYKDCTITGTIDFVFGDASAIFQGCKLFSLQPLSSQKDVVAAQGRTDPSENTGFVFQQCNVDGNHEVFLGRPWMPYSRTLFLTSTLSSQVNPQGWLRWQDTDDNLNTLFFGEYQNTGSGAAGSSRVSWATQITDSKDVQAYTADNFISASVWLSPAGIAYTAGV